MRILIILLLLCLTSVKLLAQTDPLFLLPFYFEDAVGNKDTLWLGGDINGSTAIQSQFGEVEIVEPFDSVFEVRAVHAYDNDWKTSKIIVESTGGIPNHYAGAGTRIMMHAKYPPIRISWDSSYLDPTDYYDYNKILTPYELPWLFQDWWEAEYVYCMIDRSYIIEDFDYDDYYFSETYLYHEFEIEGQGLISLPGLYFVGFGGAPYCQTILETNEFLNENALSLYPNPCKGQFFVVNEKEPFAEIRVFDRSGKAVFEEKSKSAFIQSIELPLFLDNGMYLFEGRTKTGKYTRKTFLLER